MSVVTSWLLYVADVWAENVTDLAGLYCCAQENGSARESWEFYRAVSTVASLFLVAMVLKRREFRDASRLLNGRQGASVARVSIDGCLGDAAVSQCRVLHRQWLFGFSQLWRRVQALIEHGCFRKYLFKTERAADLTRLCCYYPSDDTAEYTYEYRTGMVAKLSGNFVLGVVQDILCEPVVAREISKKDYPGNGGGTRNWPGN